LADKVVKMLYFAGSLHDASARRITLVCPYFAYQRQDRKNKSRAPIYTKYFPRILKSMLYEGDRILAMDPHNLSAFQSGIPLELCNDHLEAKNLICEYLATLIEMQQIDPHNIVTMSPDEGGVKRTRFNRDKLSSLLGVTLDLAYVDKTHANDGAIEAHKIIGDVDGKIVIVFDDMISSCKTMVEAMNAVNRAGGKMLAVCASHCLGVGDAQKHVDTLLDNGVKVVTTDTVEPLRISPETKLKVLSTVPLIAEGIRCIHNEESMSRLLR
jgi:ribose-phosphate pyrophosphokinase